ncbi:cellulose biosynthesis cyclic di-GMP-binding regulatory protein BcsB [soil metagenome]
MLKFSAKQLHIVIQNFMYLTLLCITIFLSGANAATLSSSTDLKQRTYTFKDLFITNTKIILTGYNPATTIYLPLSKLWNVQNIKLHLIIAPSPLLNSSSTLTLKADGIPIHTELLNSTKKGLFFWDISIPTNLIKGNFIALNLLGYLRSTNDICDDLHNPGNWVHIMQDSTVEYEFEDNNYIPNLVEYPYPFIQIQTPTADEITMVLPKNSTLKTLTSAFNVASSLGRQATWRGLQLNTTNVENLKNSAKQHDNLIFIGTTEQLALPTNPLPSSGSKEKIMSDTGILLLATSPWSTNRAMLTVTGNNAVAVEKAALALNYPLAKQAIPFENYALIPALPKEKISHINWRNTTLSQLGYEDQFVYGSGQLNLHNIVDLSGNKIPLSLQLEVHFGHSAFNYPPYADLMLSVNGMPQTQIQLDTSNQKNGVWNIFIPGKDLIAGKNDINFLFNLHLSDESCKNYYSENKWGAIYSNTAVQANFGNELPHLSLSQFSAPFNNNSMMILPANNIFDSNPALIESFMRLGSQMKIAPEELKQITINEVSEEILKSKNVIVMGNFNDMASIYKKLKSIPVIFENNHLIINTPLQKMSTVINEPMAIIQLIPSSWNDNAALLLINSTDQNTLVQALKLLTDNKKLSQLIGNIALVKADGSFVVLDSQPPQDVYLKLMKSFPFYQKLIVLMALLTVLLIFLAIIFYIRKIKNKLSH